MKTIYEKIEIKSEADLPKGSDAYISHSTSGHLGFRRCVPAKKQDHATFENISGEWWLKNIDWYLLPSPETEERIRLLEDLVKHSKEAFKWQADDKLPEFWNKYYKLEKQLAELKQAL